MASDQQNSNTNQKKRKLDVNDSKNSREQLSKKRKLSSCLENVFDRQKELKREIKKLKKEKDYFYNQMNIYKEKMNKYEQIYLQMIDIIKPSQSQKQSNNGQALSGHLHTHSISNSNHSNVNKKHICSYCTKEFDTSIALGGHIHIHIKSKWKDNNDNNDNKSKKK
eukprot:383593_1